MFTSTILKVNFFKQFRTYFTKNFIYIYVFSLKLSSQPCFVFCFFFFLVILVRVSYFSLPALNIFCYLDLYTLLFIYLHIQTIIHGKQTTNNPNRKTNKKRFTQKNYAYFNFLPYQFKTDAQH